MLKGTGCFFTFTHLPIGALLCETLENLSGLCGWICVWNWKVENWSEFLKKNVQPCLWIFLLCQDNPSTWQVWHIKQHDHYTGEPCAGDNKRPLKCAVVITQHKVSCFREHAIGMLTAGMSTRAVAREINVNFSTISRLKHFFLKERIWQYVQPASQPQTMCMESCGWAVFW